MRVKVIMLPFKDLQCISIDETIGDAMKKIDDHGLLTLPVVEGTLFKGVLSKQYTYEMFFREYDCTREEFLQLKVREMMKTKIDTISSELRIEEAASLFISSKVRFLPITNEKGELEGIVTQQAVFKYYQKQFGSPKYDSFTILCHDDKGTLANISEVIAKGGANIKNIVYIDTEVMGIQEIFFRVETTDFEHLLTVMKKNKLDVRNIRPAI